MKPINTLLSLLWFFFIQDIKIQNMAVTLSSLKAAPATMMISFAAFLLFGWPLAATAAMSNYRTLPLPQGTSGPESLAFDRLGGGPYTGISDGRVVQFKPTVGFTDFATTAATRNKTLCDGKGSTADSTLGRICGRPLGIAFNSSQFLFICDAYAGLYVAPPGGGQAVRLASSAGGVPINFCNGLDIDLMTGFVYFTDASSVFQLSDLAGAVASRDRTGRLLRFDPRTGEVTVQATRLSLPGGVAVDAGSSYVLVTELIGGTVTKFYLTGPNANTTRTVLSGATGVDNIKRTERGDFTFTRPLPYVHKALTIDGEGATLANVSIVGPYIGILSISEAHLRGNITYIGSLFATFVGQIFGSGLVN